MCPLGRNPFQTGPPVYNSRRNSIFANTFCNRMKVFERPPAVDESRSTRRLRQFSKRAGHNRASDQFLPWRCNSSGPPEADHNESSGLQTDNPNDCVSCDTLFGHQYAKPLSFQTGVAQFEI